MCLQYAVFLLSLVESINRPKLLPFSSLSSFSFLFDLHRHAFVSPHRLHSRPYRLHARQLQKPISIHVSAIQRQDKIQHYRQKVNTQQTNTQNIHYHHTTAFCVWEMLTPRTCDPPNKLLNSVDFFLSQFFLPICCCHLC